MTTLTSDRFQFRGGRNSRKPSGRVRAFRKYQNFFAAILRIRTRGNCGEERSQFTTKMKLPICLIGEDNKTLAALKQQLEKQGAYAVEPKVCSYGDALEQLRGYTGAVIAIMDLSRDGDRAYAVAAEFKSKLSQVRLVMTSPSHNPNEILRAMRSSDKQVAARVSGGRRRLGGARCRSDRVEPTPARREDDHHADHRETHPPPHAP